jgi:hypothetical protein
MKYIQPQFQTLVHRLRSLLPKPRLERPDTRPAAPRINWEQMELALGSDSGGIARQAANAAASTKPVRPLVIRAASPRRTRHR